MSQDPKIMSAALSRFQADRDARRNALEARRREVYRRAPRVEMIDRELTGTAARVIAAAFQQGGDGFHVLPGCVQTWRSGISPFSGSARSFWWGRGSPMIILMRRLSVRSVLTGAGGRMTRPAGVSWPITPGSRTGG